MIYNIDFLIAALVFLFVILHHFMARRTMDFGRNRSFLWLIIVSILNLSFDLLCSVLISYPSPGRALLLQVCLDILYALQLIAPYMLLCHIMSQFPPNEKYRHPRIFVHILPVIMGILMVFNHWKCIFFSVAADGSYARGPLYLVMYGFAGLYLLSVVLCCRIHRADLSREKMRAVTELVLIVGATVLFQSFYHDILLSGFGITLGITVLFFTLDNPYHYTDMLTSTFDIHYFRDRSRYRMEHQKPFHLLAVKLSQIRRVNLIMGNDVGNELLISVSRLLRSACKKNLVFRTSGNQFIAMVFSRADYTRLCEAVEDYFSRPRIAEGRSVNFPVDLCGIEYAESLGSGDDLLSYVDYLLALSARTPESVVVHGTGETLMGFRRNQEIESYLNRALQEDLFEVAFQPIYSISEKRFTAVEVLSRLHHPELGWISPETFIASAEKNRQIDRIGLLQLRRTCAFLKENPRLLSLLQNVKFNLSPSELMKEDHVEMILQTIGEYGLPPSFFQLEITETVASRYSEFVNRLMARLKDTGIRLCVDDFGSGYSNLNTVMMFPFDVIKLDRSLLFGICRDERIAALYRSLISTFHNLGYHVVAEGVETEEEAGLVTRWGVDMIQGYYYSRPLSGTELIALLHCNETASSASPV